MLITNPGNFGTVSNFAAFVGALRVPIDELPHRLSEIPKGPPIVLSCA